MPALIASLAVILTIAVTIYDRLGLSFLRRGRIKFELI
jgi:hypothetical protein